jgi:hypothetical protein
MCTASTAKRRRRQAKNQYRHIDPMRRPHYPTLTKEAGEKREARRREKERLLAARTKRQVAQ